ncbi:hypothetical protein D6745_01815 [Candidatus Woesearchaeota archaeon]|nr:MAG: hypothetical protein D6745_01815 [Candidatus Woesearchaeota archaeon]
MLKLCESPFPRTFFIMRKIIIPLIAVILIFAIFLMFQPTTDNISKFYESKEVLLKTDNCSVTAFLNKPKGIDFDKVIIIAGGYTDTDKGGYNSAKRISDLVKDKFNRLGYLSLVVVYKQETGLGDKDLKDFLCAVRWAKHNAGEYGLKLDKIYLLGHSRGGYIVSFANTIEKTNGVIANSFVTDLRRLYEMTENKEIGLYDPELQKRAENIINLTIRSYSGTPDEVPKIWEQKSIIPNINKMKSRYMFTLGNDELKYAHEIMGGLEKAFESCNDCVEWEYVKINNMKHYPFYNKEWWEAVLEFIRKT